jgi:hypothetical protein
MRPSESSRPTVLRGSEATVSTTVRETADAVAALKKDEISLGDLAAKLSLHKSAPSRRLRDAPALAISSTWRAVEVARLGSCWAIRCWKC